VLWLGETPVRFEMVYCLWLFILVLFNKLKKDTIFRINKAMKVYALFLVIVLLATLVNISSSGQSFFELSAQFYGLARHFWLCSCLVTLVYRYIQWSLLFGYSCT